MAHLANPVFLHIAEELQTSPENPEYVFPVGSSFPPGLFPD